MILVVVRAMVPSELWMMAELVDAVTRARSARPEFFDRMHELGLGVAAETMQEAAIRPNVAKAIAGTSLRLLVDAIFTVERWERVPVMKVLHHLLRHAKDDLELAEDERLALEVMHVAASYLHTGLQARGDIVRIGDPNTRRRLKLAHEALLGKSKLASGIRDVVGVLREDRDPDFVLRRLGYIDPVFERLDRAWLAEILASYSPRRPKRGSGKRTLTKIAAIIIVQVGAFDVAPKVPGEDDAELEDRTDNVRRWIERTVKNG